MTAFIPRFNLSTHLVFSPGNAWVWDLEALIMPDFDLRAVLTALQRTGVDLTQIASFYGPEVVDAKHAWPWFLEDQDRFFALLDGSPAQAQRATELLEHLPVIPRDILAGLAQRAVGAGKAARNASQRFLSGHPFARELAEQGLESGKGEHVIASAGWLSRLKTSEAIPALETALSKAKQEQERSAILRALSDCGQDIAKHLDARHLTDAAIKGLKAKVPGALGWFPFELIPAARWNDGSAVDPRVLQWWVVCAYKSKDPCRHGNHSDLPELAVSGVNELWEHLFEVNAEGGSQTWESYIDAIAVWCALARVDYTRQQLETDETLDREAVMLAVIEQHLAGDPAANQTGPLVVVTGGFHTMGLVEALDRTSYGDWIRSRAVREHSKDRPSWVVRYDFSRLDAVRGYGAGMLSPGYWQRLWHARRRGIAPQEFVVETLSEVAGSARTQGFEISTAALMRASEQCLGLMALRERSWPGRTDLLDAMLSCFVQDDDGFSGALAFGISEVFGGHRLGKLPEGTALPPLVDEAWKRAKALRFSVETSEAKRAVLDTARKPAHVTRREFLASMEFLGTGFSRHVGGADIVSGSNLGRLHEEWEYGWTPLVEAALVQRAVTAPTLRIAIAQTVNERIAEIQEPSLGQPSSKVFGMAALVTQVAATGYSELVPAMLQQLGELYEAETHLIPTVESVHRLLNLAEHAERFGLTGMRLPCMGLAARGLGAAIFQVQFAVAAHPDELLAIGLAFRDLKSALARFLALAVNVEQAEVDAQSAGAEPHTAEPHTAKPQSTRQRSAKPHCAEPSSAVQLSAEGEHLLQSCKATLDRMWEDPATAPVIRGILLALAWADGEMD